MRRIIVDSGSSIKEDERNLYDVDVIPIRLQISEETYADGVDIKGDEFYKKLKESGSFPKTSLPSLADTQELVDRYVAQGDEVLLITISSGISGTYQTLNLLFQDYPNVHVFDSKLCVGGIRFLVEEARRHDDEPMDAVIEALNNLLPRIVIAALPETLDYLLAGGRLSKASWMLGKMLQIVPVIGFKDGSVDVLAKKRGIKQGKKHLIEMIQQDRADASYGLIASYTYNRSNIEDVVGMLPDEYRACVTVYDDLTPSIACHWGPNAYGFIYVKGE